MHLGHGRIGMTDVESKALDGLVEEHGDPLGFTRRDPGNTGPLIIEWKGGKTFQIDANGRKRDLSV